MINSKTRFQATTHCLNRLTQFNAPVWWNSRIGSEGVEDWVIRNAKKAFISKEMDSENGYIYNGVIFIIVPHRTQKNVYVVKTITSTRGKEK